MSDPVAHVEDAHAQRNLGLLAVRAYQGAREEAASWREAFWATTALITAMLAKNELDEPGE